MKDHTASRLGGIFRGLILCAALLAWAGGAAAVIKVELPVSKIYQTAEAVVVGSVVRVNTGSRVIEVKVRRTLKGAAAGERLRVQIAAPAELIGQVAAGEPLVLFAARSNGKWLAVLHLADTWVQAERIPESRPPAWRVGQVRDLQESFPGRTAALVEIVGKLKAGKSALLDSLEEDFFQGGARELAKLDVAAPTFLSAADVNGDKRPDLLIGTAEGIRLFLAAGGGFKDATESWGLRGAGGSCRAFGDVNGDGRADLLLGNAIRISDGRKFAIAKTPLPLPEGAKPLAAGLLDVTGDGKPDAGILLADGRLLTFENPGAADKPWPRRPVTKLWPARHLAGGKEGAAPLAAALGDWGDDGRPHAMVVRHTGITRYPLGAGPPAGEERLTGKPLLPYYKPPRGQLTSAAVTALDANGDKRPDLFLFAEGRGLLLVNRGFGAFLVSIAAGEHLTSNERHHASFKLTPKTAWASADVDADGLDDLLLLAADGRLYVVGNAAEPARP